MRRQKELRSKFKFIMIVSEGGKTEPYYFDQLRKYLGIKKEQVFIPNKYGGSDPKTLVDKAEEEFKIQLNKYQPGYDRVFVIFDRDTHSTFDAAKNKINVLNKQHKDKFKVIISVPCFELWLVLHFKYSSKPYQTIPTAKSACDCVIDDLKKDIKNYEKGNQDTFENTKLLFCDAIRNAEKLEEDRKSAGTDNPSTNVHDLVKYLVCELDK